MRGAGWIALLLLVPATAHAGGFAIGEQSVVAAGTGGASTARDDAGAAWYDPAALVDGGGWRFGLNVVAAMAKLHAADPAGAWSADTTGGVAPVPNVDLAWARGLWAAGIAIGVPFGGDVKWPDGWQGANEIRSSQLQVARIAPFAGWRHGRVRVAGGVHVDVAHLAIDRGLDFVDTTGNVAIDLRGAGAGVDGSAWVNLGAVDVGLSLKSRTHVPLHGEANFTAPAAFSEKLADQHASSTLTLPDRVALGAVWRHGALAVLGDAELTTWSVNQKQVVDFEQMQTPDATQVNDWHTTLAWRAGAEWTRGKLVARAGGYLDPTPAPTAHMAPSSPDDTRLGATLGASYQASRTITVDASYGYMHLLGRTSTNPDSLAATYGGDAQFLGIAMRVVP